MNNLVFVTPSYSTDIERFSLLRESMERFYHGKAKHKVLVPKKDYPLFEPFEKSPQVDILNQEDFVPPVFFGKWWYRPLSRITPGQEWHFRRFAGRPGWIKQQIVKLSAPEFTEKEVIVFLDSDVVFLKAFGDSDFLSEKGTILLRREQEAESGKHRRSIRKARKLFSLPAGSTEHHYMGSPNIWRRDWVVAMREYLEAMYHQSWQQVLYGADYFSEYSLYGIFVEEILSPADLFIKSESFHRTIWDDTSFKEFLYSIHDNIAQEEIPLCIIIQSNLNRNVHEYYQQIKKLWSAKSD